VHDEIRAMQDSDTLSEKWCLSELLESLRKAL